MGLGSEMKNRNEELLASFKKRIKENEDLVTDVQKILEDFSNDHQKMASILRANATALRKGLARGEKDRLLNFNKLITGIHHTIGSIQKEVVAIQSYTFNMIKNFNNDRRHMTAELNNFYAKESAERIQNEDDKMAEFNVIMKDVTDEINSIDLDVYSIFQNTKNMLFNFEKQHREMPAELKAELSNNLTERVEYTTQLLHGFQNRLSQINKGNQKMARQLRRDLDNGEKEKLNDYKGFMVEIQITIKGIRQVVIEIEDATTMLVGNFAHNGDLGVSEWNKIQKAIDEFKKTTHDKRSKDLDKKTQKSETSAVLTKERQEDIFTKLTDKTAFPMTMEQKVLAYIKEHPMGVKVSEMEKPLGETRMKIGYTAKVLLEQGKLQKLDNIYFPKR